MARSEVGNHVFSCPSRTPTRWERARAHMRVPPQFSSRTVLPHSYIQDPPVHGKGSLDSDEGYILRYAEDGQENVITHPANTRKLRTASACARAAHARVGWTCCVHRMHSLVDAGALPRGEPPQEHGQQV